MYKFKDRNTGEIFSANTEGGRAKAIQKRKDKVYNGGNFRHMLWTESPVVIVDEKGESISVDLLEVIETVDKRVKELEDLMGV